MCDGRTGELKTSFFISARSVCFSQLIVLQPASRETTDQVNNTGAFVRERERFSAHAFLSTAEFLLHGVFLTSAVYHKNHQHLCQNLRSSELQQLVSSCFRNQVFLKFLGFSTFLCFISH